MKTLSALFLALLALPAFGSLQVTTKVPTAAAVANNYVTAISATTVTQARPTCSNLSDAATSCSTDATNATNLSSGAVPAARMPALTGDVTSSAGAVATTAAATQANIVTLSKSTGVAVHGVNTNTAATAGYVGEYVSASVTTPTSLSTSNTAQNCTSISLTAGDWDVSAIFDFALGGGGTSTNVNAGISTTSASLNQFGVDASQALAPTAANQAISIPEVRELLSGTTTVYAVVQAQFAVAAVQYRCRISARRRQ